MNSRKCCMLTVLDNLAKDFSETVDFIRRCFVCCDKYLSHEYLIIYTSRDGFQLNYRHPISGDDLRLFKLKSFKENFSFLLFCFD